MAHSEKLLTLAQEAWSEEAGRWLATTLRGVPCFGVDDYRLEVERNPDCKLFRITGDAGELVGFVVLRVERYEHGAEGVLLAAAGRLGGAQLYGQVLPALERLFRGVVAFRADPCRAGAIKHLLAAGYLPTHVTMRKAAREGHPIDPRTVRRARTPVNGDGLGSALPSASVPLGEDSSPRRELAGDDLLEALAHQAGCDVPGGPSIMARPGKLHKVSVSENKQSTQTTQIDRRQVVDNGGIGIAGESATINFLDGGAIDKAFAFANANDQELSKNLNNQLGFARSIFESGLGVLDKAGAQVQAQAALVSKAYDNAQGTGTEKTLLTVAAIASVVIVAVKVWGK